LEGLGEVLMQQHAVVAYKSRKLKPQENNYVVCDLELATVIHAPKMWRRYLLEKIFTFLTNHIIMKYFFSEPNLC